MMPYVNFDESNKGLFVELDLTPSWWPDADPAWLGWAVGKAVPMFGSIGEVRATAERLVIRVRMPAGDLPPASFLQTKRAAAIRDLEAAYAEAQESR